MYQKAKTQKILFSTGSVVLALAVLSLTIVPFFVNHFAKELYIPVLYFKICAAVLYLISLICYVFSSRYSNLQINWILAAFIYFILFQLVAKIIS